MNKSELVEAVAGKIDMSKTQTQGVIEALIEVVTKALKKGDEVRLVGFGTWTVAKRAATTGRNPRTGEPIKIPASKQPKFKAGKELKDAINNK
ncbi:MAG: HU family DNA-binding protein [Alphaproteobacteria bacterium]|mgnify:CR=1 FL=1|jgi:DNA-binding protein HU-beta|nr:HU family DNA-binding protein [Alphaproteobacteria bacterium]MBP9049919.1 HU family DNA-binding protein [Alphaproteobacteria bacterium]MBP9868712.1 HU family DNA-binding protein [Alphaproteobacteria bacterium]